MRPKKKIAIIGFGFEGRALFFYLQKQRVFGASHEITVLDANTKFKVPKGAKAVLGHHYLDNLKHFDILFRSPGVPHHLPEIQKVKKKLSSLTNLFFSKAKGTIVGITGSSGKTTTATLLHKVLKRAGRDAYLVGNIGVNPLGILDKLSKRSITVMELSSFQLQDVKYSPSIAIILDIYEEHLDKHKNFREYLDAKSNIIHFQKKSDVVIYCSTNAASKKMALKSKARKIPFTLPDGERLGYRIKLTGRHNYKNVMAVWLASSLLGVSEEIIRKTTERFRGVEHRLEFVREIRGVQYYNDSAATNIRSAIAAMDAFREKKIVLVGGRNKNLSLRPLAVRLKRADIRLAILFGEARDAIGATLIKKGVKKFSVRSSLARAVLDAAKKALPGEVILLAPGTASFDEFANYKERGRHFKTLVRKLSS